MKKILTTLLASTILCASLCACGEPASSPVEDFTYEFEDGTVTITGYMGSDLEIVIPSVIEERPVTTIGEDAFALYDMTSITLPKGITTIEKNAFNECNLLETIILPDSLQICEETFEDSKWYEKQNEGVLYIEEVVIGYKGVIPENITIKEGTKSIVNNAFKQTSSHKLGYYEGNFSSIHIPESVTYIGEESVGYHHHLQTGFDLRIDEFIIYGKSGSTAEIYANKYDSNNRADNPFTFIAE